MNAPVSPHAIFLQADKQMSMKKRNIKTLKRT